MPEGETLAAFAATGATLAIHLAVHAVDRIVAELTPVLGADCPVAVVVRASWPEERAIVGTLGDIVARLAAEPAERTAMILVGRALAAEDFREVRSSTTPPTSDGSGTAPLSQCARGLPKPLIPAQAGIRIFQEPALMLT